LRLNPITIPRLLTNLVFAKPGNPTKRVCPPDNNVIIIKSITFCCPKITSLTCFLILEIYCVRLSMLSVASALILIFSLMLIFFIVVSPIQYNMI
jgi:hypothetical protein